MNPTTALSLALVLASLGLSGCYDLAPVRAQAASSPPDPLPVERCDTAEEEPEPEPDEG